MQTFKQYYLSEYVSLQQIKKIQPPKNEKELEKLVGTYLFGTFYRRGEEDTKQEDMIFDAISGYIMSQNNDTGHIYALKKVLKKLKPKFPGLLEPPQGNLYRGTSIKTENWKKILNRNEKLTKKKGYYFIPQSYLYKGRAKNKIQSWSTKFKSASNFSGKLDGWSAILSADLPQKDLFFNTKFTNKLDKILVNEIEHEVVRISISPILVDVYVDPIILEDGILPAISKDDKEFELNWKRLIPKAFTG